MSDPPTLASLGVVPGTPNIYTRLLAAIQEHELTYTAVTNRFVIELSELVGKQDATRAGIPGHLLTSRQFSHLLAYLADPATYHEEKAVSTATRVLLFNKRNLEKLVGRVREGKVEGGARWETLTKLVPKVAEEEVIVEKELVVGEELVVEEKKLSVEGEKLVVEKNIAEDENNNLKRDKPEEREAGGGPKVQKLAPELPHLAMMGLAGELAGEVAVKLEVWGGEVTNGLVMEVTEHFSDPAVAKSLVTCVAARLRIQPKDIDQNLRDKIKKYFKQTRSKMEAAGGSAAEEWLYLARLGPGGDLHQPALHAPSSRLAELGARIGGLGQAGGVRCRRQGCGGLGDYAVCQVTPLSSTFTISQGCFVATYCGLGCREAAWEAEHRASCGQAAASMLGPDVFPVMATEKEKAANMLANRFKGSFKSEKVKVEEEKVKVKELAAQLKEKEKTVTKLEEMIKIKDETVKSKTNILYQTKAKLSQFYHKRAADKGVMARLRKKMMVKKVVKVSASQQTMVKLPKAAIIMEISPSPVPQYMHLQVSPCSSSMQVVSGKELVVREPGMPAGARAYGESTFVRLPTSRQAGTVEMLGSRALRDRAHLVWEFLRLVSCGGLHLPPEDAASCLERLVAQLLTLYKEPFKGVLELHPQLLRNFTVMSVEQTSRFQAAMKMSWAKRRTQHVILRKEGLWVFPSEKKQREYEQGLVKIVDKERLALGKMELVKTATATTATPCAFAKVADLGKYVAELLEEEMENSSEAGTMRDLDAPIYGGEVWLVFGIDKGGKSTKVVLEIAGKPHLIGMFKAADSHQNLEAFFREGGGSWEEQLASLLREGVRVVGRDGTATTRSVQLFLNGDYALICEILGHQGCASSYPSIRDSTSCTHLRQKHRDGTPHNPDQAKCREAAYPPGPPAVGLRTPASYQDHYLANVRDKRQQGDRRKNGFRHLSVVARMLLPLASLDHVVPASLHTGLWAGEAMYQYLVTWTDILDGVGRRSDLARIGAITDPEAAVVDSEAGVIDPETGEADPAAAQVAEEVESDEEDELSNESLGSRLRRLRLERECAKLSKEMADLMEEEKEVAERIKEKQHVAERVRLAAAGQEEALQELARRSTKVRVPAKRFRKCPYCILTIYDKKVEFKECSACAAKAHEACEMELEDGEDEEEEVVLMLTGFVCRQCLETGTHGHQEEQVARELVGLQARAVVVARKVAEVRMLWSSKQGEAKKTMGRHRQALEDMLAKIGACRHEYHSGGFVGSHVDQLVRHHELLATLLDDAPEAKAGFLEFSGAYAAIHFALKAKRKLEEEEINTIEEKCSLLGAIYPRVFGGSIVPKLHELTFHVPRFARRWRTVGGMREEGIEALHNICNQHERVLACLRQEEARLATTIRRVELGQQGGVDELAKPVPRKFKKNEVTPGQ